jgi:antitoxin (DNA-binding transcriptional repressor) of toxin-antitoxin stability system
MDFVTVREFRTQPGKVWKKLEAGRDLVVTRNGKPFALITFTEPDRVEENLRAIRHARFQEALAAQHGRARQLGLDQTTMAEIDAEIAATRRATRAKRARRP